MAGNAGPTDHDPGRGQKCCPDAIHSRSRDIASRL